jgi:hypothetical protein
MKKQILTLLGAGLIGLMHPAASQAGPVDFTFSYTGAVNIGSVAGTVTGEIFGLTEGATSSATNVILDGYPASLGAPSPPDAVFSDVSANSFTVSNSGQLTAADFNAQDATDTFVFILKYIGEESVLYDSSTGETAEHEVGTRLMRNVVALLGRQREIFKMCLAVIARIYPYDHARVPSHREIVVHAKACSASSPTTTSGDQKVPWGAPAADRLPGARRSFAPAPRPSNLPRLRNRGSA